MVVILQREAAADGSEKSLGLRINRPRVPPFSAASSKRRESEKRMLLNSAITAATAWERSAVSTAHARSFSSGGSIKMQRESGPECCIVWRRRYGVGQQVRPIQITNLLSASLPVGSLTNDRSAFPARSAGSEQGGYVCSLSFVFWPFVFGDLSAVGLTKHHSWIAPLRRPPWGKASSMAGRAKGTTPAVFGARTGDGEASGNASTALTCVSVCSKGALA